VGLHLGAGAGTGGATWATGVSYMLHLGCGGAAGAGASTLAQGLTLVHISAQRKRFLWATHVHFSARREHFLWATLGDINYETVAG